MAGEVTAREARAVGVQWILHPVADVNSNPGNPIVGIRSFGENPLDAVAHVKAFIEGAHAGPRNPALSTAKHFPGHATLLSGRTSISLRSRRTAFAWAKLNSSPLRPPSPPASPR